MSTIWVCNALNTAEYDKIEGKPCIDYWLKKTSGLWFYCRACRSMIEPNNNIVGGHVIDFLSGKPHVYITPIHDRCNKQQGNLPYFSVSENDLVRIPDSGIEAKILDDDANKKQIQEMRELYRRDIKEQFDNLK